jgi:hypothetical protein
MYSWAPLLFGAIYWLLAVFVIIPAFTHGAQFSYLQNYDWLGPNIGAMVRTILTQPWYVFRTAFGPDRWQYALSLLFPLAFLPLLAPRPLLMAVPPFLLNLFASDHYKYQRDIFHQYSALITPWLFVATVLAVAAISDGTHPLYRWLPRARDLVRRMNPSAIAAGLVLCMLMLSAFQFAYTQPNKVVTFIEHRNDPTRAPQVDVLIAMVPKDAPLAVTSLAATRVPLRRYLYEFPGNEFYDPALIDKADYVLGDRRRDGSTEGAVLDTLKANGQWQLVKRQGDFELLHRIAPPPGQSG